MFKYIFYFILSYNLHSIRIFCFWFRFLHRWYSSNELCENMYKNTCCTSILIFYLSHYIAKWWWWCLRTYYTILRRYLMPKWLKLHIYFISYKKSRETVWNNITYVMKLYKHLWTLSRPKERQMSRDKKANENKNTTCLRNSKLPVLFHVEIKKV